MPLIIQEHPLLLPFVSFAAGLVIHDQTGFQLPLSTVILALTCLLLSCFTAVRFLPVLSATACFLVLGIHAYPELHPASPPVLDLASLAGRAPVLLEGVIVTRPEEKTDNTVLLIRVDSVLQGGTGEQVAGLLRLTVPEGHAAVMRGDRIRFRTIVRHPGRLGLPGEFDYPRYLFLHGIAATGTVSSPDDLLLVRGGADAGILNRIDLAARRLGEFIRAAVPDREASSVLAALLLGDQKRIPGDLAAQYTRAGVNHILSVSGFHVGIISYFIVSVVLFVAVRWECLALRFNLRRAVMLLALPAMLLYLLLTGGAPATARSVIMLAAFVLALYIEREHDPVNALLTAAFLLVAVDPPALFDISFQLSFLALWGIVVFVPPVMAACSGIEHAWLKTAIQFVAASCAASLATAVPVLYAFNQTSLNGIVANFIIVPLLGYGAVIVGFCALPFIYLYQPLAQLLLTGAAKLVLFSNAVIRACAELPVISFHGITRLDLFLFLVAMVAVTFLKIRLARAALCLLPFVMACAAQALSPAAADGRLHIYLLSVGQAESLLLRLPDGSTTLVDGGGYLQDTGRDFGERYVAPALFKLGVRRIDHMILTHSHPDHIGGLPYVAGRFPVGAFWEAAPGGSGEQYDRLRNMLLNGKVPIRQLAAGDSVNLSPQVTLQVLSPFRTAAAIRHAVSVVDMNEESLVFRLKYGVFTMLFTADAGFSAENRIMAEHPDISAAVLKVGHHGSRFSTSEPFLMRVHPQLALISAGRDNRFGLPARDTINQLQRRGIRIMRTDLDGTVELVSDGRSWTAASLVSPD